MKAYTDLEQSKKLAEILPLKSADMCCFQNPNGDINYYGFPFLQGNKASNPIPCWSLASLLDALPDTINGTFYRLTYYRLTIDKEGDVYNISYDDILSKESVILYAEYSLIDACYEMVIRLNELNLL